MKKVLFLISVIAVTSFSKKEEGIFDSKSLKKEYAKVKEDLYVSRYEVSNLQYRIFLADLVQANQTATYTSCLPDTLCWRDKANYNEPYVAYYFRYPAYNNYPVVGVSYEAANEYCSWLTNKYNQDAKRKFRKVIFKLLSEEEWIFSANDGDTSKMYTWGSGFMQNNRHQFLCNFKHTEFVFDSVSKKITAERNLNDRPTITGPVNAFYPNSSGLYNMCGNAAEMVSEKGIAKGGSYLEPAYNVRISSTKNYSKPQADIGFRVAMKIIEK